MTNFIFIDRRCCCCCSAVKQMDGRVKEIKFFYVALKWNYWNDRSKIVTQIHYSLWKWMKDERVRREELWNWEIILAHPQWFFFSFVWLIYFHVLFDFLPTLFNSSISLWVLWELRDFVNSINQRLSDNAHHEIASDIIIDFYFTYFISFVLCFGTFQKKNYKLGKVRQQIHLLKKKRFLFHRWSCFSLTRSSNMPDVCRITQKYDIFLIIKWLLIFFPHNIHR
jgi:hypothetical protein